MAFYYSNTIFLLVQLIIPLCILRTFLFIFFSYDDKILPSTPLSRIECKYVV